MAARQVSDTARGMVATFADDHAQHGDFVEEALRLRALADEVLDRAVVLERERNTTWDGIGAALGGNGEPRTRQAAEDRFGERVKRWRAALVHPLRTHPDGHTVYSTLPDGAEAPDFWARELDEWVLHHAEPTDVVAHLGGEYPVSAGLNTDPFLLVLTEEKLIRQQALDLQARRIAGERLLAPEVAEFHRRRMAMVAWIEEVLPRTEPAALRDTLQGAREGLLRIAELVPAAAEPTP
jgi:hypothetical protein